MARPKPYDYLFKFLLLGDSGVGKPFILYRFSEETFSSSFVTTIGIDFRIKNIVLNGKRIKLQIWDTAGQERFRSITTSYYRGATGILLVFDLKNRRTFDNLDSWLKSIELDASPGTKVVLVGNNCHREDKRAVSQAQAREFASSHGIDYFEVSGKKSINIEAPFLSLASKVLTSVENQSRQESEGSNTRKEEHEKQKDSSSIFRRFFNPIFSGKTQNQSVPEEIGEDPYAFDLYEKALRDGTERDRSIRINVVGNFRQGKTTLVRRILGQKIGDVTSTDGIDVSHYKYCRKSGGKLIVKKAKENDKSDIIGRLVSVALTTKQLQKDQVLSSTSQKEEATKPCTAISRSLEISNGDKGSTFESERQSRSLERNVHSSNADTEQSSDGKGNEDFDNKMKIEMLSLEERKYFTKELKMKKSQNYQTQELETSFDIWDFGGQYIFYATHTLFHSKHAIYLLVFDLTAKLEDVVVDEDFPDESSENNMEYFLRFWMNSIHSFIGSEDGSEPRVILVGTHKDKIKGSGNYRRKYIENYFNRVRALFDGTIVMKHFHIEDFAVASNTANDESVAALRDTIITLGNEMSRAAEIPAKWIPLEKSLTERKHIKLITFEFVLVIDAANEIPLEDPEQIKLFLRYHHNKGTFIYFDEEPISNYVVLDPQYLIDAFKCIITCERFCTNDPEIRPFWNMLRQDARLERSLIDKQWGKDEDKMLLQHRDILLAFLTKHHIISEATYYDDTTQQSAGLGWFVVPSLLKAQIPETEFQQFLAGKNQTLVRFVMIFDCSTIVPTIFHRLMAALMGKWPITQFGNNTLLSKDQCAVRLNVDHVGIADVRYKAIELMVVNLRPSSDVSNEPVDSFRRFTEAVINHEFIKLHRKNEDHLKPYSIFYRCNHVTHGVSGSLKIINADNFNSETPLPCPDLMSHEIESRKAKLEWTRDFRESILVTNPHLSDKVLGRISRCIGMNWQLLGLELGVTQVQIEQISEEHRSVAMRIYYMLKTWSNQMTDSADINVLVQKMQDCANASVDWDEVRNIVDEIQ